ncbi:MAG: amino acid dehydrogenase, partial [Mesorhizobium sp.]
MQQNSKEGGGPSSALRASSSRSRGEAEDIAIIGGGIIGICAATLLAEAGRSVI